MFQMFEELIIKGNCATIVVGFRFNFLPNDSLPLSSFEKSIFADSTVPQVAKWITPGVPH